MSYSPSPPSVETGAIDAYAEIDFRLFITDESESKHWRDIVTF